MTSLPVISANALQTVISANALQTVISANALQTVISTNGVRRNLTLMNGKISRFARNDRMEVEKWQNSQFMTVFRIYLKLILTLSKPVRLCQFFC